MRPGTLRRCSYTFRKGGKKVAVEGESLSLIVFRE